MTESTRRNFARTGFLTALSYSRALGANDRVRIGYIGLGNRGDQVHAAFLEHGEQQTVAVCDLKDSYMDFAIKKSRATPKNIPITKSCSMTRTSIPWSSPRLTTGTR